MSEAELRTTEAGRRVLGDAAIDTDASMIDVCSLRVAYDETFDEDYVRSCIIKAGEGNPMLVAEKIGKLRVAKAVLATDGGDAEVPHLVLSMMGEDRTSVAAALRGLVVNVGCGPTPIKDWREAAAYAREHEHGRVTRYQGEVKEAITRYTATGKFNCITLPIMDMTASTAEMALGFGKNCVFIQNLEEYDSVHECYKPGYYVNGMLLGFTGAEKAATPETIKIPLSQIEGAELDDIVLTRFDGTFKRMGEGCYNCGGHSKVPGNREGHIPMPQGGPCKYYKGPREESMTNKYRGMATSAAARSVRTEFAGEIVAHVCEETEFQEQIKSGLTTRKKILKEKCGAWIQHCFFIDETHEAICRRLPCAAITSSSARYKEIAAAAFSDYSAPDDLRAVICEPKATDASYSAAAAGSSSASSAVDVEMSQNPRPDKVELANKWHAEGLSSASSAADVAMN